MKRIKLLVFMMLGMSCLFQSCKSDLEDNTSNEKSSSLNQEILNARNKYSANVVDNSILDDYELKDGVIHFKDFESFKKTKSLLADFHISERADFLKEKGFLSRLSVSQKVLEQINSSHDLLEKEELLKKYNNFFVMDGMNMPRHKISDDCLSAILTNEGMVYIGKVLYMFTDDTEYIVYDGDRTKLSGIKNGRVSYESPEISIISTFKKSSKNQRTCQYMEKYDPSFAGNQNPTAAWWAKVHSIVDAPTYYYQGNNQYAINVHTYSKGVAIQKNVFNNTSWECATWNTLSINYSVKMFSGGSNTPFFTSQLISDSSTKFEKGTDFHVNTYAYNQPAYLIGNVFGTIEDSPGYGGMHRYNHEFLGANQWLYPSCN